MRQRPALRLTALLLLMAYVISGTSVMPGSIALAAGIEGSHAVYVSESEHGTRVMLHHTRESGYTPCVGDHRTALARLIVSLSNRSPQGDHQIVSAQCDSGPNVERQKAAREATPTGAVQPAPARPHVPRHHLFPPARRMAAGPAAPEYIRPHALTLLAGVQMVI